MVTSSTVATPHNPLLALSDISFVAAFKYKIWRYLLLGRTWSVYSGVGTVSQRQER